MFTTLAFLAALTISPAEEEAILRQVLDMYFLEIARRGPDARESLFLAQTAAAGELDVRTLIPAARSGSRVAELAESIEVNNREAIALPELKCPVRRAARDEYRVDGRYDWQQVDLATGGVDAIVEVARPGFTRDGCLAAVRIVVRQPSESYQLVYMLERTQESWRLVRSGRGNIRE